VVSSQRVEAQTVRFSKDGDCTRGSDRCVPRGLRLPAGKLTYRSRLTPAAGATAQEGRSAPPG